MQWIVELGPDSKFIRVTTSGAFTVEDHLKNDTRIGPGKAAILMGSPAALGTARQYESLVAGKASADMRIFLVKASP